MTINPFLVKSVARAYDQQHDTGRRIARFKKYVNQGGQGDVVSISTDAKRKQMVEKVTSEIVDNLVGSESNNPVVREIKNQLTSEAGQNLAFRYASDGSGLQILKDTQNGVVELTSKEKDALVTRLREITLDRVNKTML